MDEMQWDELKYGEITVVRYGDKYRACANVSSSGVFGRTCENIPAALEALHDRVKEQKAAWKRVDDKVNYLLSSCNKDSKEAEK